MKVESRNVESHNVETLRWREGRLELIDQRKLPLEFEYVACDDAAQTAAAIRDMVVRGAPAIGCTAAYGVALEAQRHDQRFARTVRRGARRIFPGAGREPTYRGQSVLGDRAHAAVPRKTSQ